MTVDKIDGAKLAQSQTAVPICRIHVYTSTRQDTRYNFNIAQSDSSVNINPYKVPVHWAGRPAKGTHTEPSKTPAPGAANTTLQKPFCILGFGGRYIQNLDNPELNQKPTGWHVLDARVNLTRQWSCSSAMFHIATELDNTEETVGLRPPIMPNDCVVIEMGYVKSLRSKINITKEQDPENEGNTDYNNFSGDVVFYGIVDTIKERGGSGESDGVVFTVMCRDMMSFLVDNKMRGAYIPRKGIGSFNRAFIIRDMIYRGAAIDYVKWQKDGNGKYLRDPNQNNARLAQESGGAGFGSKFKSYNTAEFGPDNCYVRIGTIEVSEREEIAVTGEAASLISGGMSITDRFPVDVIKHFSLVETAPRELWADHRSGDINWMYRRTDARVLYNPATSHLRQYFYRFPKDRANIISYTNEWSTAATITHFTFTNPAAGKNNDRGNVERYIESPMADLRDPHDPDKPLRLMTRNRFVFDDTIAPEKPDGQTQATVLSIAGALFNIWGRAIETGMVMIQGDPSLEIGEAVQLFNTGFFGKKYTSKTANDDPDKEKVHKGVHRVEALTHMFATGGATRGYTTTFIFGPVDTPTSVPPRLVTKDKDIQKITAANGKVSENKEGIYVINPNDMLEISVDTWATQN